MSEFKSRQYSVIDIQKLMKGYMFNDSLIEQFKGNILIYKFSYLP